MPLAVELKQINKWFGHVHANKNVNLDVECGQIHAIIGENGAGKSTLVSILYGFHKSDSGSISINGNQVTINEPATALASGIAMGPQHFMLVQNFTVLENVILGNEGSGDILKASSSARITLEELINRFGLSIDLDAKIEDLPVGIQQRVEILKALYRGA
ncbi:MAG: ATP-binding cassette domain-containing protein, partial [Gammaproteobacteria bacterium]